MDYKAPAAKADRLERKAARKEARAARKEAKGKGVKAAKLRGKAGMKKAKAGAIRAKQAAKGEKQAARQEKRQAEADLKTIKDKKLLVDQANMARSQKILSWKRSCKELLLRPNAKRQKNLIQTIANTNTEVAKKIKKT